jgi:DNA-binding MarR family transcriptional regulator
MRAYTQYCVNGAACNAIKGKQYLCTSGFAIRIRSIMDKRRKPLSVAATVRAEKAARLADLRALDLEKMHRCLNFQLRRTARLVSRRYDAALRPLGLRSTQFNIMAILAQNSTLPVSRIAEFLATERTALARNLRPLERKNLIIVSRGPDKRTRIASLTANGRRTFLVAFPVWERTH